MRGKKTQAAIFMIVGLIILMGGIIFFYSTEKIQKQIEPEIKIVEEQIPVEFDPVRKYANDCAYAVAVDGLKLIGKQGGYVSMADKSFNKEPFTITRSPTESDAVIFTSDSDLKIPYWWYLKSANNCKGDCKFSSKRPDLRNTENSIEKQLERYINSKFEDCLNNFEPFIEQGFKVSKTGQVKADVTIASEDVAVLVEAPINAEIGNTNTRITQFLVRVPVNLDKVYELATKITNLEMDHHYLEKHVLNLLVAFSGINKDKLPPMSDMQFEFGSALSWQRSEIKNRITDMLASYIQLFQVDGTYNYERTIMDSELKQRLYDSTILPVANSSFSQLAASFAYLDFWPVYFDLNCKGERCVPKSANSLISFFGIQDYRFAYDLSFPILVTVEDPFALNEQGYSFRFFLEGNIRNNNPMPVDFSPLEIGSLSEASLLCDTRTSGNVSIKIAQDSKSKQPVEDAQILYTIIDESCFIGTTDSSGALAEKFPVGIGGVVNVLKNGYIGKAVEFDPRVNSPDSLQVELSPIYTKKLIVRKKNVAKTSEGWKFVDTPVDISNKEAVAVTLTRIGNENELEFSAVSLYEGSQKNSSEIEIAPGNYVADLSLMLDQRIIVPEKEECVSKGILGKECYKTPKVDFGEKSSPGQEKFPEGGLRLNFTLSADDLSTYGTLVLYVISIDLASVPEQDRVIEDLDQLAKVEDHSKTYQQAVKPAFQ